MLSTQLLCQSMDQTRIMEGKNKILKTVNNGTICIIGYMINNGHYSVYVQLNLTETVRNEKEKVHTLIK